MSNAAQGPAVAVTGARASRPRSDRDADRDPDGDVPLPRLPRVAIVDSDSGFLTVLKTRLRSSRWEHRVVPRRVSAKRLAAMDVDALVVDLSLVGERRWKWLGSLCELAPDLRIVVCTASSTVAERVCGLRLGVADWLSKPCHPEELIARLEAITREPPWHERGERKRITIGEVEVCPHLYQARAGTRSVRLTRREYRLLEVLFESVGEGQPRELLYERIWGRQMTRNERAVDVAVYKLRRKLEHVSPRWRYIHTDFGAGYRLDPQPARNVAPCATESGATGVAGAAGARADEICEYASETVMAA